MQLIKHGNEDKARNIIWRLQENAKDIDENDAVVGIDVREISQAIREETEASAEGSFKLIFQNGDQKFLYRTLLGMGGQMMQQISGINLITYVSSTTIVMINPLLIPDSMRLKFSRTLWA